MAQDVDTLFPPDQGRDVDTLFPPDVERQRYRRSVGASPIQDLIFGDTTVNPVARVLDAFGQGAKQNWGAGSEAISDESADFLKKSGVWNDYQKGQHSIIKSANEVLMRGAATQLYNGLIRFPSAVIAGGQAAVAQIGEELGDQKFGREIAALPEAFPLFGAELGGRGVPHPPLPAPLAQAQELGIIGQGEAGWKGTAPPKVTVTPRAGYFDHAEAVKAANENAPQVAGQPETPSPSVVPVAAPSPAAAPAPDIHAVAREIAPEVFTDYDALSARKETFRRWIDELRDVRDQTAENEAPHAQEIAELEAKMEGATPRLAKKYQARLDTMTEERDAFLDQAKAKDSRDMASIREKLMQTDYAMRDLAPKVAAAYRQAEERMPKEPAVEQPAAAHVAPSAEAQPPEAGGTAEAPGTVPAEPSRPASPAAQPAPRIDNTRDVVSGANSSKEPGGPVYIDRRIPQFSPTLKDRSGQPADLHKYLAVHEEDEARRMRAGESYDSAHVQATAAERAAIEADGVDWKAYTHEIDGYLAKIEHEKAENPPPDTHVDPQAAIGHHRSENKAATPPLEKRYASIAEMLAAQGGELVRGTENARVPEGMSPADADRLGYRAQLPPTSSPSIAADVTRKLVTAGRPTEEAEAAGALVAAYWETRAERFKDAKGTADQMYAAEGPEIKAGKEKARAVEMAQKGKTFEQAPETPAFKEWFGDSKIVDPETGKPAVVYHGTTADFDTFSKEKAGSESGAPSAKKGFFFSSNPDVAWSYAEGLNPYKEGPRLIQFVNWVTGGRYEKANEAILRLFGKSAITHGENLKPVFLSIKNPLVHDFEGNEYRERSFSDLIDDAKAGGHDGVVFKNAIDQGYGANPGALETSDIIVAFEPEQIKSATGNRGTFDKTSPNVLEQEAKGRIRLRDDGRATITLLKNADASTFIHETGHEWLDRMLRDAADEQAPADLKADADTVLKWLGADSADALKTRHHEKFARGFETYMMEGRAPSQGLAAVFAKFKEWLTTIYRTVAALKAPISEDIRAVFDRLLSAEPQRTVIAPEREAAPSFADAHEKLAETTAPEAAREVANTVQGERDTLAAEKLVQDNDARLADIGAGTERRAPGGAQPASDGHAAGPAGGEGRAAPEPGALDAGGSEAASEGAGAREEPLPLKGPAAQPKKSYSLLQFIASRGGIRADEKLVEDLRQSIGGKNKFIPGFGQLIRVPKQLSTAALRSGRYEAMNLDTAREAAAEAGYIPEDSTPAQFLDLIDRELRGERVYPHGQVAEGRPVEPGELERAQNDFAANLNDFVKESGGTQLTDKEHARALELWRHEGLNDPAEIIERLALEADDTEVEAGHPARSESVPGWDVPDEPEPAPSEGGAAAPVESAEPGSGTARSGGGEPRETPEPVAPTDPLPRSETKLLDKAGNIRLDNLGTPEDVNAVIRQAADELAPFNAAITRGVISDAQVLDLADALGMDAAQLSARKLGEAFNAEQIVAARKLLIQSAGAVRDAMAKAATGSDADVLAYAEARARHLMIQEQVSGITAEAGRALRAFRNIGGEMQEAAALSDFLKTTQGKTLYQLKQEAQLGLNLETPQQISKAIHDANLTFWQKLRAGILSWFINNLISGPLTHAGYSVGNSVTQLFKATVTTSTTAAIDSLRAAMGRSVEDRVYFGEVGAQLYGMVRGFRDGLPPAVTALKTGISFMKGDAEGVAAMGEAALRPQAIPGRIGYIIETPSRSVAAIHTVHYSMNYEAEIARRAYRTAIKEGLNPGTGDFNTRVADFTQSPPEKDVEEAHNEALGMVLMQRPQFGTAQYHLQKAVNNNILAKVVMPFMQIGSNILYKGLVEPTPLGLASKTVRDNLAGRNGEIARSTQIAKIGIGIGISGAVVGLTAEGILTDGGPSDPKQLALKEATGWKPYSIRVGEYYVPYRKLIGPLGTLVAAVSDIYATAHALSDEGLTKAAASAAFGIAEVIADETWMRGLANFIDAARHWDRDGGKYLRNLAADFIPFSVGLRQVASVVDPVRREVRTMLDAVRAHLPGLSQGLHPVRDIWGEPMQGGTMLSWSHVNNDPATKAMLDTGYFPARIERKVRGQELTDQQYDDLTRVAGRMAKMRVNAIISNPGFQQIPQAIKTEQLKNAVDGARETARTMILMQNKDIIEQARLAKVAKLRGEKATAH